MSARVGIIMGSRSDLEVMQAAADMLDHFGIPYGTDIVSAHRTPDRMRDYARNAAEKGFEVIIAGAGGAAHLPGMTASMTTLPVIGVPIRSSNSLDGWDSLLSIAQMPGGIPVATMAVNGAKNAGILAARMIGNHDTEVQRRLEAYEQELADKVEAQVREMKG